MKRYLIALNLMMVWLFALTANGAVTGVTFTILGTFNYTNNGAYPCDPPVLSSDGNLYGTAFGGGSNGFGTIFKATNGSLNSFYTFSTNVWDGASPNGGLLIGRDGNFYGVTTVGGSNSVSAMKGGTNGLGTIFKLTTNGVFTLLYSFGNTTNDSGYAADGANPYGTLVQGRDGNFYGVTTYGGDMNFGTVFQFSTNGILTTLHSFNGDGTTDDGAYPYLESLVEGSDGVFYGTTAYGGTNDSGTVFQITSTGVLTTLFEFNGTNGLYPYAGLNFGPDGNLYGTTYEGGKNEDGNIFQITTNGFLKSIFEFSGTNGMLPQGGVVADLNNNLYGTTFVGGTMDYGSVFRVTTNGLLSTLYSFTNGTDGAKPFSGVMRDTNGNLYGTATYGGNNKVESGVVFRLSDSTRPTNTITVPTANQRLSNNVFVVTGTAKDNVGVANVFYSLNSSIWTAATLTNNRSNWSAQVTLTPGTNVLRAYSTDDSGNVSVTNTVNFIYVVNAPLSVSITGKGTVTTNYNGALLQIGVNYSMTAAPSTGFGFASWTGSITTNNATLKFMMASNLTFTANFVDTAKPTNSITAPTANQNVSNAVFTVTGKASDNVGVTNVFYSLNSSDWFSATTTNNWTNWTTQVILTPGTNTLLAYAADAAGNVSSNNSVKFVYVLSAPLTVSTNGRGSISPNYNGALLQIGASYSMTATPSTGFGFASWTGSVTTNNAALKFVMASNLTFTANFVDTAKPTNSITTPTANQNVSNAVFTVTGKASDNVGVTNVFYSLNSSDWLPATTTNNWTNWTAQINLTPGTNTLLAYAADAAGNVSSNNSVKFVYVLSAPLVVGTNGFGTISPNYNGTLLQIGLNYSMTATATKGFTFTGWTGSATTNNSALKFMMASNLTFTANFIDTTRPTNSITSPTSGQHMTNALATIIGKATDNWGCSGVLYQVNTGAWSPATSTNGYTNWTATATLISGTNTLKAYAIDLAGNFSATNSLSVVSSNSFLLRLDFTNAQPSISGGLSFTLETSPGLNGHIQASTNLSSWANLTNFIGTNSTITITDGSATNSTQKFYRAVVP